MEERGKVVGKRFSWGFGAGRAGEERADRRTGMEAWEKESERQRDERALREKDKAD